MKQDTPSTPSASLPVTPHASGVYQGTPAVDITSPPSDLRIVRTMKGDIAEATKIKDEADSYLETKEGESREGQLSASMWSRISRKSVTETTEVSPVEIKVPEEPKVAETIVDKEPMPSKFTVKAKTEIIIFDEKAFDETTAKTLSDNITKTKQSVPTKTLETVAPINNERVVVTEKTADVVVIEKTARGIAVAKIAQIALEEEIIRAEAAALAAKTIVEDERARVETIDRTTLEEGELTKAAKIAVERELALVKEVRAVSLQKIVEAENRASVAKTTAEKERVQADAADVAASKEMEEATVAEVVATKERSQADAAEVAHLNEKARIKTLTKTEADNIIRAEEKVDAVAAAAVAEVVAVEKKARVQASNLVDAQERAREETSIATFKAIAEKEKARLGAIAELNEIIKDEEILRLRSVEIAATQEITPKKPASASPDLK